MSNLALGVATWPRRAGRLRTRRIRGLAGDEDTFRISLRGSDATEPYVIDADA